MNGSQKHCINFVKEARYKRLPLTQSSKKGKRTVTKSKQISGCQELGCGAGGQGWSVGREYRFTSEWRKGAFGDNANVPFHDCGRSYMSVHLLTCWIEHLKLVNLVICKLCLNKAYFKKQNMVSCWTGLEIYIGIDSYALWPYTIHNHNTQQLCGMGDNNGILQVVMGTKLNDVHKAIWIVPAWNSITSSETLSKPLVFIRTHSTAFSTAFAAHSTSFCEGLLPVVFLRGVLALRVSSAPDNFIFKCQNYIVYYSLISHEFG